MLTPTNAELVAEVAPGHEEYIEIDIDIAADQVVKKETTDKFAKMRVNSLPANIKKRANTLNKRMQNAEGDVKSKYIDDDFISGYALYDLALPPYDLDALARIYEEHAIHHSAVNAKAVNCVGLGYKWEHSRKLKKKLEKAQNDKEKHARIIEDIYNQMEDLDDKFENFNEEETFEETFVKAVTDMYALGNGYIEIGRRNDGTIGYVGHVPATQIRVRKSRDGFVQQVFSNKKPQAVFFRNYGDQDTRDPLNGDPKPNELIHLKQYSPTNTYYGVPAIVTALSSVVGDKFASEFNIDYFENKAIPRYAIIIKGAKLSEKGKQELIKYFRNEVKGKNHGTLVIPLPATMGQQVDVKFEKLEGGVQDSSFEKYRKANRDTIVSAHRVPPTKVGIYDNANLAVSRDADKTFKEQVIGPDQERLEKRINRIVSEFTDALIFRFVKLDIVDEDMKSRIYDRYLRTEVMTPNEVRSERGQPAIDGGEKVLPFATKVQQEKIASDERNQAENRKAQKESAKIQATTAARNGGAPTGNTNNPKKTGPETPKDDTGTRAERGESQDSSGVRERS